MNAPEQANKPAINIQELSNGEDWVIPTVIRESNEHKWYLTHEQPAEQKAMAILNNSRGGGKWPSDLKQDFCSSFKGGTRCRLKQCERPLWIWVYTRLFPAPYVAVLESKAQVLHPPLRHRSNKSCSHSLAPNTEEMVNRSPHPFLSISFLTAWSLPNPSVPPIVIATRPRVITQKYCTCTGGCCADWSEHHSSAEFLAGSAAFFGDEVTPYSSELVTLL